MQIFGTYLLLLVSGMFVYLAFRNKKVTSHTERFISQVQALDSIVIENVRLRYWRKRGLKYFIDPTNRCDLYLFHNCLAVVRKKNNILKVCFAPILITSDIQSATTDFPYLYIYQPTLIRFKKIVEGEIDFIAKGTMYNSYAIDFSLKGLTKEQTAQLEKIKNWVDVCVQKTG